MTRGLVFHEAAFTQIEQALADATTRIQDHVTGILDTVNAQTAAWTAETPSRQAQREYEQRLRTGLTSLTEALDTVRTAVANHHERAREAEVENVAIVG
jgi:uncharacterized protein YukE